MTELSTLAKFLKLVAYYLDEFEGQEHKPDGGIASENFPKFVTQYNLFKLQL